MNRNIFRNARKTFHLLTEQAMCRILSDMLKEKIRLDD